MFSALIRRFSMRFSVTLNRSAISRTVYPDNSKTIVSASRAVKRSTPAICCPLSKSGGAGWWCTLSVRGSAAPQVVLWRGRGGLVVFAPCRGQPVPGGVRPGGVHADIVHEHRQVLQYGIVHKNRQVLLCNLSILMYISARGVPCQT